jgi:hypothetical protein
MTFLLKALFPILLLVVPMFLIGQTVMIMVVGFTLGIMMAALALGSTGFRAALSGGERGARFYLWTAVGFAVLAGFITLFVSAHLDALSARPVVHAQVSMMPSAIWGGAVGFLVAAALTWFRRRSA